MIYAWRSFEAYPISVGLAGAESVRIPAHRPDGRHDLEAMAAAVTVRTKVILLCTPNNPTGPILTAEETERFIQAVPSDVVVVIDEAYQEFVRAEDAVDGIRDVPQIPQCGGAPDVLQGPRPRRVCGWATASPSPELTQYLRVAATPFAVSQIAEQAAVVSLQNFDQVVERVQSLVDERDRVTAGLRELGWFVPEAQGNFVWLDLGENSAEFAELAGERALSVRAFGNEGVRVSIGEVEANTPVPRALCGLYKAAAAFLALNKCAGAVLTADKVRNSKPKYMPHAECIPYAAYIPATLQRIRMRQARRRYGRHTSALHRVRRNRR